MGERVIRGTLMNLMAFSFVRTLCGRIIQLWPAARDGHDLGRTLYTTRFVIDNDTCTCSTPADLQASPLRGALCLGALILCFQTLAASFRAILFVLLVLYHGSSR